MKKIPKMVLMVLMGIQIILGIIWIIKCGFNMPVLEDANMYIKAAGDGVFDEYTGFLYPVFLRLFYAPFGSSVLVAIIQTVVMGAAVFYAAGILKDRISLAFRCLVSAYILTFPFVLQMCFLTLPDILAIALLLVWARSVYNLKIKKVCKASADYIISTISFLGASLFSKKYFHIILMLWIVVLIVEFVGSRKNGNASSRKNIGLFAGCMLGGVLLIFVLSALLVKPGANHRMPGTLNTGLMTTYAFEAFESDYTFWPYEAQLAIPFDYVRYITFSKDYVITKMGPMLMADMDYSKVDRLAFGITLASLKMRSKESIMRTITYIGEYIFFPVTVVRSFKGDVKSMSAFRLFAFTGDSPFYAVRYFYISYAILFLVAALIIVDRIVAGKSAVRNAADTYVNAEIKSDAETDRKTETKAKIKADAETATKTDAETKIKADDNAATKYLREILIITWLVVAVFAGLFSISYFDYFYTVPVTILFILASVSCLDKTK